MVSPDKLPGRRPVFYPVQVTDPTLGMVTRDQPYRGVYFEDPARRGKGYLGEYVRADGRTLSSAVVQYLESKERVLWEEYSYHPRRPADRFECVRNHFACAVALEIIQDHDLTPLLDHSGELASWEGEVCRESYSDLRSFFDMFSSGLFKCYFHEGDPGEQGFCVLGESNGREAFPLVTARMHLLHEQPYSGAVYESDQWEDTSEPLWVEDVSKAPGRRVSKEDDPVDIWRRVGFPEDVFLRSSARQPVYVPRRDRKYRVDVSEDAVMGELSQFARTGLCVELDDPVPVGEEIPLTAKVRQVAPGDPRGEVGYEDALQVGMVDTDGKVTTKGKGGKVSLVRVKSVKSKARHRPRPGRARRRRGKRRRSYGHVLSDHQLLYGATPDRDARAPVQAGHLRESAVKAVPGCEIL